MVGHHPTNKLISREPIPHQNNQNQAESFQTNPCRKARISRISYPFEQLSRKVRGRLLTCYSPVRHSSNPTKARSSAFDLHVLSTPPAFVLSQDQTLIKSLSSHSFLSLTDLLFFSLFSTTTSVVVPCTLVRLVQFSKVFVALTTTILVYHSHFSLSTGFFNFF